MPRPSHGLIRAVHGGFHQSRWLTHPLLGSQFLSAGSPLPSPSFSRQVTSSQRVGADEAWSHFIAITVCPRESRGAQKAHANSSTSPALSEIDRRARPSPSSQPPGSPGFSTTVLALGALFNGLFNHLPQQQAALHNILCFKNIFEPELERERFGFSPRIAF